MSRLSRAFLLRHALSQGNLDRSVYATTPDHAVPLADAGFPQARAAGAALCDQLGNRPFTVYLSPYLRALQTWYEMWAAMMARNAQLLNQRGPVIQDPRLREQEWSANPATAVRNNRSESWNEALKWGWFYYRFEGGESVADTHLRLRAFWREMLQDCPTEDAVIVTHGIAIRALLMAAQDWTVDDFYTLDTPPNCSCYQLNRHGGDGWGPTTYRLDPSTPFPRFTPAIQPDEQVA